MLTSEAKLHRKNLFRKAKLAEQVKRYDHTLRFMKEIVNIINPYADLTPKERSLLGAAFKNFVSQRREILSKATAITQSWRDDFTASLASSYLPKCKEQISATCSSAVNLIDERLFPSANSNESKVFYLTLKGDFSCYSAEAKGPEIGFTEAKIAESAYTDASVLAMNLDSMDPHRLALMLSLAEYKFAFLRLPLAANVNVETVLNLPAVTAPDAWPVAPLFSFEGGFQLLSKFLNSKLKIRDFIQKIKADKDAARVAGTHAGGGAGEPLGAVCDLLDPAFTLDLKQ